MLKTTDSLVAVFGRRPNHDDADQPTPLHENNLSFAPNASSSLANRPNYMVTNADTSCSSSQGLRFGSRNPIDVSYLSSRHVHKQVCTFDIYVTAG